MHFLISYESICHPLWWMSSVTYASRKSQFPLLVSIQFSELLQQLHTQREKNPSHSQWFHNLDGRQLTLRLATSINLPAKYMAPNHHKPFLHLHQSHKIESIYMPRRSNLHEIHVEEVMNGWPNGLRIIIIIHSIQVPRKNRR